MQVIIVKLREAMEAHHRKTGERITYALLAERTGLSEATLQSLGSRRDYNTTLDSIDRLCRALNCGLNDLLAYEADDEPA